MLNRTHVQVLTAAANEVTRWLAATMARSDLRLRLVTEATAKWDVQAFVDGVQGHRKVKHWDWLALFHKRVKYGNAWMFAIDSARGRAGPRAMCWGKLELRAPGYVSIEYLERRPFSRMSGLTTVTAFQFVLIVAEALEVSEVCLVDPFPQLVSFYSTKLGVSRHPPVGRVQYLFKKIKS